MAARNPKHADPNDDVQDAAPVRKRTPKESCLAFCSKYFCEGQRVEKELQEKNVPLLASSEGRKLLHFDGEAGAPPAALDFAGAGAAGGDAAPAATGGV